MHRVWLDNTWVEFDVADLKTNKETKIWWETVLDAMQATAPDTSTRPPRFYNNKIAKYLNDRGLTSGITADMVRHIRHRIRKKVEQWQQSRIEMPSLATIVLKPGEITADQQIKNYRKWIGLTETVNRKEPYQSTMRMVVVFGDLHGSPHKNLLPAIFEACSSWDEDISFLGGGDFYNIFASVPAARLLKDPTVGTQVLRNETAALTSFTHVLCEKFPHADIVYIDGNHDMISKIFAPDSAYSVIKVLREYLGVVDPVARIAEDFEQVRVGNWQVPYIEANGEVHESIYCNRNIYCHGDLLISHTNQVGMNAHRDLWHWIQTNRLTVGLDHIRVALQAHTHRVSFESMQNGHVVIGHIGFGGSVTSEAYKYGYKLWPTNTTSAFVVLYQEQDIHGHWKTIRQGEYGPRHIFF